MAVLFGYLGVVVILGFLSCFKGRDLFRLAVAAAAFVWVFSLVCSRAGGDRDDVIIASLAGLVAALLSGFVIKIGVTVIGVIAGFIAGNMLAQLSTLDFPHEKITYIVICVIIFGALAVKALNLMITICTAAAGGSMVVLPCMYLVLELDHLADAVGVTPEETVTGVSHEMLGPLVSAHQQIFLAGTLVLCLVGIFVQIRTNHRGF